MPELRRDPVVGRWVIIATERLRRPTEFARRTPSRTGGPCPFCAGHESETPPEILAYRDGTGAEPNTPGWRVRVIPSKFPALRVEGEVGRRGEGIYDLMNGVGAHEIVVESPEHDVELSAMPEGAVESVLRAFRERIADLKRDDRFRCVTVFKNRGTEAGATREHGHSQLLATPVVPRAVSDEVESTAAYYRYRERCLFCDILRAEVEARCRLVVDGRLVVAFAPFAARLPFETWVAPRRHTAAFEHADDATLRDLARVLRTVLRALDHVIGEPPYNLVLHTAPFGVGDSPSYHWHVEILPKITHLAGFELGSGLHINPVPPEDAARFLRDAPGD